MASRTHQAVVTVAKRAPLETKQLPTPTPTDNEVLVKTIWTASTPLDLHQADGGLLVKHPQVLGSGMAGRVVAIGPAVNTLKVRLFVLSRPLAIFSLLRPPNPAIPIKDLVL